MVTPRDSGMIMGDDSYNQGGCVPRERVAGLQRDSLQQSGQLKSTFFCTKNGGQEEEKG